jgi:hypothetical protein
MKRNIIILTTILILISTLTFAQTTLKEYKAGHIFDVSLPDYMSRTVGLNDASAIQYKSVVKDVYGFIIFDTKEELRLAEMTFSSINEFYEGFIKDFLADQESRKVSDPKYTTKGGINFVESDATYFDKDLNTEIYYLAGVAETKSSFYKVLSWSAAENKEKFKTDFQKILYSVKD